MTDEAFAGCLLWGQNCGSIHICCDVYTNKIYSKRFVHRSLHNQIVVFLLFLGAARVALVARWGTSGECLYQCICRWFCVFTEMENPALKTPPSPPPPNVDGFDNTRASTAIQARERAHCGGRLFSNKSIQVEKLMLGMWSTCACDEVLFLRRLLLLLQLDLCIVHCIKHTMIYP